MKLNKLIIPILGLLFVSCDGNNVEEDELLSFSDMTLRIDVDKDVPIPKGEGISWEVDNKNVAKISTSGSKISPVVSGRTVVRGKKGAYEYSFNVTSTPTNYSFDEPSMDFGAQEHIIENRYPGGNMSYKNYEPYTYAVKSSKPGMIGYVYLFEDYRLIASAMMVKTSYYEEIGKFLSQRYLYAYSEGTQIYTLNSNKTIICAMEITTDYIGVVYMPYNSSARSSSTPYPFDKELMKKLSTIAFFNHK